VSAANLASARLTTDGGLPYTLLEGFPRGSVETNGPSGAQEQYRIRASDLEDFIAEIVPPMEIIDSKVVIPPLRAMPGAPYLIPSKVSFEPFNPTLPCDPFGQDSSAPAGTYVDDIRLTIDYETSIASNEDEDRDDADPDSFLEQSVRSSLEVLNIPASGTVVSDVEDNPYEEGTGDYYTFARQQAEKPKAPTTDIRLMVCINEFSFKWKRVLRPNFSNMFSLMGTTNNAVHTWLLNAPKTTVMFLGISGSREFQSAGTRTIVKPWSLDLRFAHKQINHDGKIYSWNHVFDPSPGVGKFVAVFRSGSSGAGSLMHPAANFNLLFAPGPAI
jgi:hypothetical protein